MAKTRSRSRKSASKSKRATATKKKTASRKKSRARAARPRVAAAGTLDLHQLRGDIDKAMAIIAQRLLQADQPSAKLDEAQAALSRWAAEIDDICDPDERDGICGPTMLLPLS